MLKHLSRIIPHMGHRRIFKTGASDALVTLKGMEDNGSSSTVMENLHSSYWLTLKLWSEITDRASPWILNHYGGTIDTIRVWVTRWCKGTGTKVYLSRLLQYFVSPCRSRHQLAGDKSRAVDPHSEPASRVPSSTSHWPIYEVVTTPFVCRMWQIRLLLPIDLGLQSSPGWSASLPRQWPVGHWVLEYGVCTVPFPARHAPCAMHHAPCTVSVCMTSRSSALDDRPWSYTVPLSW